MTRATVFTLALLVAWLALLMLGAVAHAEQDMCRRAALLVNELHDAQVELADMKALAAQICAERALKKECARQRIEIRAYEAELLELERETLAALRACNSARATRKVAMGFGWRRAPRWVSDPAPVADLFERAGSRSAARSSERLPLALLRLGRCFRIA